MVFGGKHIDTNGNLFTQQEKDMNMKSFSSESH